MGMMGICIQLKVLDFEGQASDVVTFFLEFCACGFGLRLYAVSTSFDRSIHSPTLETLFLTISLPLTFLEPQS